MSSLPPRAPLSVRPDWQASGSALPGSDFGGLKSKVLAAHRAGFKRIVMPKQNERDLPEIAERVRNELEFVLVEDMREVLAAALETDPVTTETARPTTPRPGTGGGLVA